MEELSRLAKAILIEGREAFRKFQRPDGSIPWEIEGRPKQLPPEGDWTYWLKLAGRGEGKTRSGAEWIHDRVLNQGARRLGLLGSTASDTRGVMVEGPSGILATARPGFVPQWFPGKREIVWPNGAIAQTYSAEKPSRLRGPQFDTVWCDEICAWKHPEDAWDMVQFGLRIGDPRVYISTTPRPLPILTDPKRGLLANPDCRTVVGTTYENRANLSEKFFRSVIERYQGTRLGDQELLAIILGDTPGALWNQKLLDELRVDYCPPPERTVIAVDPAVSTKDASAETGIVGVTAANCQCKGLGLEEVHLFVREDFSAQHLPLEWALATERMFEELRASCVIGEINQGGNLVEANLRTVNKTIPFSTVWAHDGKRSRAEPISGLYQQRRVHHVGRLAGLESQMTTWQANNSTQRSPDRVDALVYACTELLPLVRETAAVLGDHEGFSFHVEPRL